MRSISRFMDLQGFSEAFSQVTTHQRCAILVRAQASAQIRLSYLCEIVLNNMSPFTRTGEKYNAL